MSRITKSNRPTFFPVNVIRPDTYFSLSKSAPECVLHVILSCYSANTLWHFLNIALYSKVIGSYIICIPSALPAFGSATQW